MLSSTHYFDTRTVLEIQDLEIEDGGELKERLQDLLAESSQPVVLDIHSLHHVNSSFINAIVYSTKRSEKRIAIVGASHSIRETLDLTGLPRFISVFPKKEALEAA